MKQTDEAAFLHTLMNPLAIALGLLELVTEASQENTSSPEVHRKRIEKAYQALERAVDLVRTRQADLCGTQQPGGDRADQN